MQYYYPHKFITTTITSLTYHSLLCTHKMYYIAIINHMHTDMACMKALMCHMYIHVHVHVHVYTCMSCFDKPHKKVLLYASVCKG